MNNHLRGLVFSRNPISLKNANGKTMASFLASFEADEIAQIFTSNQETDFSLCSTYYKLDESAIIKNAIFHKQLQVGKQVYNFQRTELREKTDTNQSNSSRIKRVIKRIIPVSFRNYLWKHSGWIDADLKQFIRNYNPDFFILSAGNLVEEFLLALWIKRELCIPIIVTLGDDYYSHSFFESPYKKKLRSIWKSVLDISALTICISQPMQNLVKKTSSCRSLVAVNSTGKVFSDKMLKMPLGDTIYISYLGNIELGRGSVLCKLGKEIKKVNRRSNPPFCLKVYSPNGIDDSFLKMIENNDCIKYCGSVFGDDYISAINQTDILLHVESFDRRYKKLLSTACSTKIGECFLSRKLFFVIAPYYSESGNIVKRNTAGIVCNNYRSIAQCLYDLQGRIHDGGYNALIENALEYGMKYFDREKNAQMIRSAITDSLVSSKE